MHNTETPFSNFSDAAKMKAYPDGKMPTGKFSKLLFTEPLPVRRGNFYLDRAAADEPPDNLLRNN